LVRNVIFITKSESILADRMRSSKKVRLNQLRAKIKRQKMLTNHAVSLADSQAQPPRRITVKKIVLVLLLAMVLAACVPVVVVDQWPAAGAHGANSLRAIFGVRFVAHMETFVFTVKDTIQRLEYQTGLKKPAAPWQASVIERSVSQPAAPAPKRIASALGASHPSRPAADAAAVPVALATPTLAAPTPTRPAAVGWRPADIKPFGKLSGEGVWQPYIQNGSEQALLYKTFLSPDPDRPYAIVDVIAIDISKTQLHFALGSEQPYESAKIPRAAGRIPPEDQQPDQLLAAFNGGFMVEHGRFGAMVNGLVTVHPKNGLGTLAIYRDGSLRMGAWGEDIQPSSEMAAYRQNGPLAIKDGQRSTLVAKPSYWGYTISGDTVTWRSGLGLSQDGRTLYYLAGPSLSIQTLTDAMQAAGLWTAMQLDINKYWVHFVAIHPVDGQLICEPLDEKDMKVHPNRYLVGFSHDFFYITAK
jgi:hypothetical protein